MMFSKSPKMFKVDRNRSQLRQIVKEIYNFSISAFVTVERKNILNQNNTGHLKIKNYTFERVENFKYLGVILNEDNKHRTHLQERIKNTNKTYFMLQNFFKNKNISKKLKLILKNTII